MIIERYFACEKTVGRVPTGPKVVKITRAVQNDPMRGEASTEFGAPDGRT
jgi:hypothetical protein